jgi:preprotein translocase subunit SecE
MSFEVYKRGQGYYTRLFTAIGCGIIAAIGCWRLYEKLGGLDTSASARIWIQTFVPVGVFIIFAILIFVMVNRPKVADFMIAAEGEMKKVSWSSKKEIAVSTFIVIVVVISIACLLMFTDLFFQFFFRAIHLLE